MIGLIRRETIGLVGKLENFFGKSYSRNQKAEVFDVLKILSNYSTTKNCLQTIAEKHCKDLGYNMSANRKDRFAAYCLELASLMAMAGNTLGDCMDYIFSEAYKIVAKSDKNRVLDELESCWNSMRGCTVILFPVQSPTE